MKSKLTRTFICIDFPSEVIKEVARIQTILEKRNLFTGKLIELENLHITLKFLGNIDDETLKKVHSSLSKIKFHELNLKLDKVGTFNHKGKPKIIWIKIAGLYLLQKQIDEALSNLFPKEQRFMSHLTIARIKHTKSSQKLTSYISNIKPKKLQFLINNFKIKSSDLSNSNFTSGPIYNTLKEYTYKK